MSGQDGKSLRSTIARWATLGAVLLAYLVYLLGHLAGTPWLQLVGLVFLSASLVSFVTLVATGRHSWRNTLGLILVFFPSVALAVPNLAAPEINNRSRCRTGLKQLQSACLSHAGEHGGELPATLGPLVGRYLKDDLPLVCPSRLTQLKAIRGGADVRALPEARSYVYVAGLRQDDPPGSILALDEEWNHYGQVVHVLLLDGGLETVKNAGKLHGRLEAQAKALEGQGREMELVRPSWSRYPDPPTGYYTPWSVRPTLLIFLVMGGACILAVAVEVAVAYLRRRRARRTRGK